MIDSINPDDRYIKIYNSRWKELLLLLGSLVFVVAGVWILYHSHENGDATGKTIFMSYSCIILFGMCAILFSVKFFDKKPALIIDDTGITIGFGFGSQNLVKWDNIEKVYIKYAANQQFIAIRLINPEEYIEQEKSNFKRKAMTLAMKAEGPEIAVMTNVLQCDINTLYALLTSRLQEFKRAEKDVNKEIHA